MVNSTLEVPGKSSAASLRLLYPTGDHLQGIATKRNNDLDFKDSCLFRESHLLGPLKLTKVMNSQICVYYEVEYKEHNHCEGFAYVFSLLLYRLPRSEYIGFLPFQSLRDHRLYSSSERSVQHLVDVCDEKRHRSSSALLHAHSYECAHHSG